MTLREEVGDLDCNVLRKRVDGPGLHQAQPLRCRLTNSLSENVQDQPRGGRMQGSKMGMPHAEASV